MKPIIITLPHICHGEARALAGLSRLGSFIHIRKPDAGKEETARLLRDLSAMGADMSRFTLHYDMQMAVEHSLGGVHLRERDIAEARLRHPGMRISASAHNWEEACALSKKADYVFISPLFDSISKQGYKSSIDITEAPERLSHTDPARIVALGGISEMNIASVYEAGFGGAALLGAVWSTDDKGNIDTELTLNNYIHCLKTWQIAKSRLYLISDGNMATVRRFLEGGGRWVQLRMKETPREEVVLCGREMLGLCREYDAVLLINDDPQAALEAGADGVHLGKSDSLPDRARALLPDHIIIGSTANTIEDITALEGLSVDYIGLGPYRFTTTKRNLAPVLGTDGYRNIIRSMRERGISLPVVAIGGILPEDVAGIIATGVHGIAVSGAISAAPDAKAQSELFLDEINKNIKL